MKTVVLTGSLVGRDDPERLTLDGVAWGLSLNPSPLDFDAQWLRLIHDNAALERAR